MTNEFLLETGDFLLLETGDNLLLEVETLALVRSDEGSWASSGEHTKHAGFTSGSFTPPDNSLLVVVVLRVWSDSGDILAPALSGGSLSYTSVGYARLDPAWAHRVDVFYAPVTTGASMTILANNPGVYDYIQLTAIGVIAYTGYDTGTPVAGYVTSAAVDIGDGAETQTLAATPTENDVSLAIVLGDASADPNPDWGTGWSEILAFGEWVSLAERTGSTSTSVTVDDSHTTGTFYGAGMLSWIIKAGEGTAAYVPRYGFILYNDPGMA